MVMPALRQSCFNPLPAVRPGGTWQSRKIKLGIDVSIRSRLLGREEPAKCSPREWWLIVSIRSRLLGREEHVDECINNPVMRFQSAPGC